MIKLFQITATFVMVLTAGLQIPAWAGVVGKTAPKRLILPEAGNTRRVAGVVDQKNDVLAAGQNDWTTDPDRAPDIVENRTVTVQKTDGGDIAVLVETYETPLPGPYDRSFENKKGYLYDAHGRVIATSEKVAYVDHLDGRLPHPHSLKIVTSTTATEYGYDSQGRVSQVTEEITLYTIPGSGTRPSLGVTTRQTTVFEYQGSGKNVVRTRGVLEVPSASGISRFNIVTDYFYKDGRLSEQVIQKKPSGVSDWLETSIKTYSYGTDGRVTEKVYTSMLVTTQKGESVNISARERINRGIPADSVRTYTKEKGVLEMDHRRVTNSFVENSTQVRETREIRLRYETV